MTEYKIYVKDRELREHIYHDVDPHALQMAEEHEMDDIQFNIYNFLCRGEFSLRNGDADMYFNPESRGIGWSHDRNWVERKLQPLIKAQLVSVDKVRDCRDGRYSSWYFYDSRFRRDKLAVGSCFVTNHYVHKIRKRLGLCHGWWWRVPTDTVYNGIHTTIKQGTITVGMDTWKKRKKVVKVTMQFGPHKKQVALTQYMGFAHDFEKIESFIDMLNTVGDGEPKMVETTDDLEEWFTRQYNGPPRQTTCKKYSPRWKIQKNRHHRINKEPKYEIHVSRVEGGNVRGLGGVDCNRNSYCWDTTITEDELNRHGFTCQRVKGD